MSAHSFQLPDLRSFCQSRFELRINPRCRNVTLSSQRWMVEGGFSQRDQKLRGAKAGLLAAACYPTCDEGQLRFVTDFISLLMVSRHLLLSDFTQPSLCQFWRRISHFRNPSWHGRFSQHMHAFHFAQAQIARDREHNAVPDLESYMELKRYSSGLEMAFDLIEYAEALHLPEAVFEDPMVQELRQNAMDIISWSTDIFSYSNDLSRGDKHNLVAILIEERHLTPQGAITCAGNFVQESIATFLANEQLLPSWADPRADDDVQLYVQGLRDWIVGSIHWAFETEWYFGANVEEVRTYGWVFLTSKAKRQ